MQAMFMSKQVKYIISGPEFCMETGLPPGKYNEVFISCKTDIIISNNTL